MKLHFIETGKFKLDGGAMFGVVPKRLWQRQHPPDENNMCTWSMRCLLIETGDRKILVDTGIGNKQDEKFRSHFEPHGEDTLHLSLERLGYSTDDITDVLLTHLHFDHVGGAVSKNENGVLLPTFSNAQYWTNQKHWDWAMSPNPREKASFLKENMVPLWDHDQLEFIDWAKEDVDWLPGIQIRYLYGHTEAMMMPIIQVGAQKIYYCADLLPSHFHVSMPYVMSYDIRPLLTLEEKKKLYEEVVDQDALVIFEHDPAMQAATLKKNERGRIVVDQAMQIKEFIQEA